MDKLVIATEKDYNRIPKIIKLYQKQETPENAERHKKIINSEQKIVCVSMSNIRMIAKAILKGGEKTYLEIAKTRNKENELYEETLIQGLVIAGIKDLDRQMKELEWWICKIDNWGTCDSTVSTMKGLKKAKDKDRFFDFYYNLCFSEKEFVSRFGIVTLMVYFLEEKYIDKILLMCETVKQEKYYIQMAQAWLLSYAFMKFKDKTYKVFEKRTLSKFVQNKAISKCRDSFQVSREDKDNLINFRIK